MSTHAPLLETTSQAQPGSLPPLITGFEFSLKLIFHQWLVPLFCWLCHNDLLWQVSRPSFITLGLHPGQASLSIPGPSICPLHPPHKLRYQPLGQIEFLIHIYSSRHANKNNMFLEKAAFLKAKPSIAVTIRKYLLRLRDVPWWNSGTKEDRCTQRGKKKNSVKTYTGSSSILLTKHHRVILCLWKKKNERKQSLKKIGHQRNLITPTGLFYKEEMLTWQLGRHVFYGAFSSSQEGANRSRLCREAVALSKQSPSLTPASSHTLVESTPPQVHVLSRHWEEMPRRPAAMGN